MNVVYFVVGLLLGMSIVSLLIGEILKHLLRDPEVITLLKSPPQSQKIVSSTLEPRAEVGIIKRLTPEEKAEVAKQKELNDTYNEMEKGLATLGIKKNG